MKEQILKKIERDQTLYIHLKQKEMIDPSILEKIRSDAYCIEANLEANILSYSFQNLVPLSYFLEQYIFQEEEGYCFLIDLLERAINVNRNKPVLLDTESIYVSSKGTEFGFIVLPLQLDCWMYRHDECKEFIQDLARRYRTNSAYEISGYLYQSLRQKEFSIPNVIIGLKMLQKKYFPKKWYHLQKRESGFIAREEIGTYCSRAIEFIEEEARTPEFEHTQILFHPQQETSAYLYDGQDRYELMFEQMIVGRAMSCEIRLQEASVSLKHAKITKTNERYYLQDLKSANGTFLGEKRVIRKMRLKNGMKIVFANKQLEFHEPL